MAMKLGLKHHNKIHVSCFTAFYFTQISNWKLKKSKFVKLVSKNRTRHYQINCVFWLNIADRKQYILNIECKKWKKHQAQVNIFYASLIFYDKMIKFKETLDKLYLDEIRIFMFSLYYITFKHFYCGLHIYLRTCVYIIIYPHDNKRTRMMRVFKITQWATKHF